MIYYNMTFPNASYFIFAPHLRRDRSQNIGEATIDGAVLERHTHAVDVDACDAASGGNRDVIDDDGMEIALVDDGWHFDGVDGRQRPRR